MSMKKPEDIISLIKSLSKSEKRYFKLFIAKNSIGESSHYLKLFDLIEKAGTTESKVIKKLYQNDRFVEKQFGLYKHMLYKQILKSLKAFHSAKSVDDEIMELIRDAKILFDKTLYDQASTVLKGEKYCL